MPQREVTGDTPVRLHSFTYENVDDNDASPATKTPAAPAQRTTRSFIRCALENNSCYDASNLSELYDCLNMFTLKMRSTNCYDKLTVEMLPAKDEKGKPVPGGVDVKIVAKERNWYKLRVGGGVKQFSGSQGSMFNSSELTIPTVQFESSLNLLNLMGSCESISTSYNVDQGGTANFNFTHFSPLLSANIPTVSSKVDAKYEEVDHSLLRSYREASKGVSWALRSGAANVMERGAFAELEWSLLQRDVLPTLHPTIPYAVDASSAIVGESGPNLKHGIKMSLSTNGGLVDDRFSPTRGVELGISTELAGPPGDVGFIKAQGSGAIHLPLGNLSLHLLTSMGAVKSLSFGGYCLPTTLCSDRFHVGGPLNLRGFKSSGIGPRAPVGPGSDGGDSLGGEFFHTATAMVSGGLGGVGGGVGARLFGFGSAGTLCNLSGITSVNSLVASSRLSLGVGLTAPTPLGRLEATYSKVLRQGEVDVTQPFQFGVALNFG